MKGLILAIFVVVLWQYPEARVTTANVLRSTANFLSPIERPIDQRSRR